MADAKRLVNKLWNYCNILRDDGLSYGDYVEQLTYLLFLKMDDERSKPPYNKKSEILEKYNWQALLSKDGADLETHYIEILRELGKEEGIIGVIFRKAQNKIQDPAKLRRLIVELIDKENWLSLETDVKGDAYEGLLERNAADVKGGAGQYFTPRPLINAIVEVTKPEPGMKIHDPACGTGGFLLSAYNHIVKNHKLDRDQKEELKHRTFSGNEIVAMAARLCVMNLYLHGINGEENPIDLTDSLKKNPGAIYEMVLTNPPFGKHSSEKIIIGDGDVKKQDMTVLRNDFWAKTSNKQLNFLQHVRSILKINGKAAIVLPDNALFDGGAGETIRKKLMETCDLHTILRLPTGVFYAQGVMANVLFFDKRAASKDSCTSKIWIYDLRTNRHFTLKENPLSFEHLKDFIQCYNPKNRHRRKETDHFKCFKYEDILKRDKTNLNIFWLRDESLDDLDKLPAPDVIANEIVEDLVGALEQIKEISDDLMNDEEIDQKFMSLEKEFLIKNSKYLKESPNKHKLKLLVVFSSTLISIRNNLAKNINKNDYLFKFQYMYLTKAINRLFSIYILLKNYYYDSAYSDVRYLFESYLLMRGLNRKKDTAEEMWGIFESEIKEVKKNNHNSALYDFEYVKKLHSIKQSEKDILNNSDQIYKKLYSFLSNKSSHPNQLDGALNDSSFNSKEDNEIIDWSLILLYGILKEFTKGQSIAINSDELTNQINDIFHAIENIQKDGMPKFLFE